MNAHLDNCEYVLLNCQFCHESVRRGLLMVSTRPVSLLPALRLTSVCLYPVLLQEHYEECPQAESKCETCKLQFPNRKSVSTSYRTIYSFTRNEHTSV